MKTFRTKPGVSVRRAKGVLVLLVVATIVALLLDYWFYGFPNQIKVVLIGLVVVNAVVISAFHHFLYHEYLDIDDQCIEIRGPKHDICVFWSWVESVVFCGYGDKIVQIRFKDGLEDKPEENEVGLFNIDLDDFPDSRHREIQNKIRWAWNEWEQCRKKV